MNDDWRAETQLRLSKSLIYQALRTKCLNDGAGAQVEALVDEAVFYAFQKTKLILIHMGEFTLHDGDHLFRVLLLMEKIISPDQIEKLSIPELMLLILTAFFHDIGMAAEERDVVAWKKVWDIEPVFSSIEEKGEYLKFQRYCHTRPEQFSKTEMLSQLGKNSEADLLKNYMVSDYIRITHAERAREIIKKDWSSKIKFRDTDLTVEFASICYSHNEDALKVLNLDHNYLCGPDTFACLPLVATILRLADLLDFDAKRTPEVLFSHLFVRHPVSLKEWNKHRAIESWYIGSDRIQFHAKCKHPAIQASINAFCDIIDKELAACNNIFESLSLANRNISIKIPLQVDRSKIETQKNIDGQPEFIYRQTQFHLSKSQVIDLLMGTKLYGNPEVALRELLQNSIDACLLRAAMEKSWNNLYVPEIEVRYIKENGEDILEVSDNGIGMDQKIIDSYYTKVGSSFYNSSDFYDLQYQTKSRFTPTSRFGIGILSSFMVADTMVVDTRKLYAPHESSDPINLTVEGQESIFWIRPGGRKVPGTTTKLFLRKNKNPWERMSEEQFVKSVENVVPNPPFKISIESNAHKSVRDENSFKSYKASSLKNFSWGAHENIKEIDISFSDTKKGFVGSAVVAVLEKGGLPTEEIHVKSQSITIDGSDYQLAKNIALSGADIIMNTTSITIDDDGEVEESKTMQYLAKSVSRLSFHGIEIPTTLFPDHWSVQRNQVKLSWPFPILIVLDICGERDLDLNSSRTQVILSDKWTRFEQDLAQEVCQKIYQMVGPEYWAKLKGILIKNSNNEFFKAGLAAVIE